ncbi:MAG: site-2 protease family protein [Desulfuromonadales bacterium]|nr:site-2 protease family protein [Desulfuromonadales bacterium]
MIGWASVPYDPKWAYDHPRSSAQMSAAGPAANLILVLISVLFIRLGVSAGVFVPPDSVSFTHVIEAASGGSLNTVALLLDVFFSLNLLLLVFNLLPIPPLDGSGIVPLFLKRTHAQKYIEAVHSGAISFIGIVVAWNLFDYVYEPLHLSMVNLLFYGIAQYG